jgi:hypothetical protein
MLKASASACPTCPRTDRKQHLGFDKSPVIQTVWAGLAGVLAGAPRLMVIQLAKNFSMRSRGWEGGLKLDIPSVGPKAVQEARGADGIIEGHAEGILDLGLERTFVSKSATDPGCKLTTRSDPKPASRFAESCYTAGEMPASSSARLPGQGSNR